MKTSLRVRAGLHTYGAEEVAAASRRKVPQRLPHLLRDARGFSTGGTIEPGREARSSEEKRSTLSNDEFCDARSSKGNLDRQIDRGCGRRKEDRIGHPRRRIWCFLKRPRYFEGGRQVFRFIGANCETFQGIACFVRGCRRNAPIDYEAQQIVLRVRGPTLGT